MNHDKPKESIKNDLFKRVGFSSRIVELIKARQSKESIVIGINGPWGEGKTTVLNFVAELLENDKSDIVVLRFNPWLFNDEEKLLTKFFLSVSKELSKSLSKVELKAGMSRSQLNEDLKNWGSAINDYTESIIGTIAEVKGIPAGGIIGKLFHHVGKKLTTTEIEKRKESLSKLMEKYGRKMVVIIDDIDRLSKDEIYSIFRLVKLTADFDRFYYLLAFDGDRVAEAIGERFGSDKQAGTHFLEKIIQVPLDLPKIRSSDLNKLFFKLLTGIFTVQKIELEQEVFGEYKYLYDTVLQNKINSPRKVIRYCNAIQFVLPMMDEELNIIDLMLIEYVKIFHLSHFEFITDNADLLTVNTNSKETLDFREKLDKRIKLIESDLLEREVESIRKVLMEMFPVLQVAWNNVAFPSNHYQTLVSERRIASKEFFHRYLTLSLGDDEISEKSFKSLLEKIKTQSAKEISDQFPLVAPNDKFDQLIQKFRTIEDKLEMRESKELATAFAMNVTHYSNESTPFGFDYTTYSQAALLIAKLIKNVIDSVERKELTIHLLSAPVPFEFAMTIFRWINAPTNSEVILTPAGRALAQQVLITRCKEESISAPFYLKFPNLAQTIILEWNALDNLDLQNYMKFSVISYHNLTGLLISIAGKISVTSFTPNSIKSQYREQIGDFTEHDYKLLAESIGTDWIYDLLIHFGLGLTARGVLIDTKHSGLQTKENIVKQFLFWHHKGKGIDLELEHFKTGLSNLEDVASIKLDKQVSVEIIESSIIPLLKRVEERALEFVDLFDEHSRYVKISIVGNSSDMGNTSTEWNRVQSNIVSAINDADRVIQMLDYSLSLRGYKKSVSNKYMQIDIKIQFNEYNFWLILNNNYSDQITYSYEVPFTNNMASEFIEKAVKILLDQIRSANQSKR